MKTIVIDPGHGGYDYGAVNGARREKDDTLRLGLALRNKLQQYGQRVVMTRTTDVYVPLNERAYISNRNNADLFISLHRNSSIYPGANGVENYVQYGAPPINTQYARNVLINVVNAGVQSNRGVKQGDFAVLRNTRAPAQLLELGFISNYTDNLLFDRNFDAYADAIARGIMTSLNESVPGDISANQTMRNIQQTLNSRYNAGLNADGIFGPLTGHALTRGLQLELNRAYGAGLNTDGVFGPRTKAAVRNIKNGDRGNLVWLLQAALFSKGYQVTPDGIAGNLTDAAIRQFQRDNALTPDGIAGKNTVEKLFS